MRDLNLLWCDRAGWRYALLAGVVSAVLVWLISIGVIEHVPLYDELLHVLAARGVLADGQPVIAHGEYTRALLFTRLVAASFEAFGDNLVAARMPSLIAALLLAAMMAGWVTRQAGFLAGLAMALMFPLLPSTVELAVFARFYTVHSLLIGLMAIAAYQAAQSACPAGKRIVLVVSAVLLIPLAWHFQSTTLVAVGAIGCGIAALLIADHWQRVSAFIVRNPLRIAVAGGLLAVIAAVLFIKLDLASRMGEVPLWAAWTSSRPQYYLIDFANSMPLLWPMFPVVAVLAIMTYRRLGLFSVVVVLAALAVHSIAAAKSVRYISYALPFFAIVWACAIAGVVNLARSMALSTKIHVLGLGVLGVLVLALSQEGQRMAKLVLQRMPATEALSYAVEPDWQSIKLILQPEVDAADRVVTSNSMKAIYYLGRYDYELNASIVLETDTATEFGMDERTGRQAIGTATSIGKVLQQPGSTLVVLEDRKIGNPAGVSKEALSVIISNCIVIELPPGSDVSAWRCNRKSS